LATLLSLSMAACGGSNSPTAPAVQTATATPPPPVSTVVAQGGFAGLPVAQAWASPPFTTTSAGRLEVTVDWTFARTDLDVYVLRGTVANCTIAQFNARQCDLAAFSESVTAKPEKVTVASAPAGTYTILVANWGPDQESFSYQAVSTSGASAATSHSQGQPQKSGALRRIVN
jgi:hypothetical protein